MAIRRHQGSTPRGRGMRPGSSRSGTPSLRVSTRKKPKASPKRTSTRGKKSLSRRGSSIGRSAKSTKDHRTIQRWAESRGGSPATVTTTARRGQKAGILRIDFPGYSGKRTLKKISWEQWFDKFDQSNLVFLYQEKTASGKTSRFFKLIDQG